MDRAPYIKRMFFYQTLYIRFEKHVFNAWYEKHAFYHPLKSICLHIKTHALNSFSRNARSGKRVFLQNIRFTYVTSRA